MSTKDVGVVHIFATYLGNTPVHMAFKSGKIGLIIEFIHNGADLNVIND